MCVLQARLSLVLCLRFTVNSEEVKVSCDHMWLALVTDKLKRHHDDGNICGRLTNLLVTCLSHARQPARHTSLSCSPTCSSHVSLMLANLLVTRLSHARQPARHTALSCSPTCSSHVSLMLADLLITRLSHARRPARHTSLSCLLACEVYSNIK